MKFSTDDEKYMRRALCLAAGGQGFVNPNPMVGAVIVAPGGRIIGEGWHRVYGGPHAEVNAVGSVSDADSMLFPESTIYVTLEPCSHYGKTPPCADLLVRCHFKRAVIGAPDPNPKVAGKGIAKLRAAGIEVDEGLLADESMRLNASFMTAHMLHRPFVTLKWAQSSDGYMDIRREGTTEPYRFSTPESALEVHKLRASHDAIAVGAMTFVNDHPRLDTRLMPGHSPRPVVFDRHDIAGTLENAFPGRNPLHIVSDEPIGDVLARLYAEEGITSVLVEGGPSLLRCFIEAGLWDAARVETAPVILGESGAAKAPVIAQIPYRTELFGSNTVAYYSNNPLVGSFVPKC